MVSSDTNNLKLSKQTEETNNNDSDSTVNEISYGPGVVQKLCARFLQLSKEPSAVPLLRSPRFKRRKSSAENNFTVISEIRRCNTQTLTTSKLTNKALLNATKSDVNSCDEQKKDELHFVPAVKVIDTVELNGTYLYHATVIPGDTKANRKAKKIESIREKFEKISATSSSLPHKKLNKFRFRRGCSSSTPESVETHEDIRKAQHDENFEIKGDKSDKQLPVLSDTVKVVVKLAPPNENRHVTELSTVPSVSSLSNFGHSQQKELNEQIKKTINTKLSHDILETNSSTTTTTTPIVINTSVKISDRKEDEKNALQEVHRLLKKFNTVREQRAKKGVHKDIIDNRYDTGDHNMLTQLKYRNISQVSIPHPHAVSVSDSGLCSLYKEKKECLKNINLNKEMNALGSDLQSVSQKYYPEETNDDTKHEKETEENRTVAAVSSTSVTDDKQSTTGLKTDDERSEFIVDGIELKSSETLMPVGHNVGLLNTTYSNKSNWETHRKSLTAMYLEKKNMANGTDLQGESCSSELPNARITKDEGPVRQSLLSLVMDEDVPELMEAMAEKLEFVFEDLTPSVSSTGEGILRNSAKRTRSRPREARLEFHSSSPTVFTYPDEESAVEKAQWDEGKQITFTVYRELCEGKKQRPIDENHKSHNLLRPSQMANNTEFPFVRTATLMEEPSMAESLLGVTGRISYNNAPMDLARFNKNTVSLIAGK